MENRDRVLKESQGTVDIVLGKEGARTRLKDGTEWTQCKDGDIYPSCGGTGKINEFNLTKNVALEMATIDKILKLNRHDPAVSHEDADNILCDLLLAHGYFQVVAEYKILKRWFE
jgi:hypothetical protein